MTKKIKIQKNTVQETLVLPLYARKACSVLYPALFQDRRALELIEQLDYDFSELKKKMNTTMGRFGALEVAMRQNDLSIEVRHYLKDHPHAAVVNLGCGLDQTGENCDNGSCRIYNIDFPDVIAVRNELLGENEHVRNVAANLTDTAWFDAIDASGGVVFFAAGVFYYFKKTEVQALFQTMAKRFAGGVLVFDTAGRRAVKLMIKSWVKKLGIDSVNAYFSVDSVERDICSWFRSGCVSTKGYMLGYHDLKDPAVSGLFRLLAKLGDEVMKMQIVKISFEEKGFL